MFEFKERSITNLLASDTWHPVVTNVYQRRALEDVRHVDYSLAQLPSPDKLKGADSAAQLIAASICAKEKIVIVGDFDADGATSTALAMRALRAFGAEHLFFRVPDRVRDGYGLSVRIVRELAHMGAQLIITVDNGISAIDAVAEANALGIKVVVTDHHLPGAVLPGANCIVNPNQPGCEFPSKYLAGVGVMFYVLMCVRRYLREHELLKEDVNLAQFLDLVAIGTVADVVPLDHLNRILVSQGLQRIRAGYGNAGVNALLRVAKKENSYLTSLDLGFAIGPRINAAGRLDDMTHGILCLMSDGDREASNLAMELDALNAERRNIEADMLASAEWILKNNDRLNISTQKSLVLHESDWHQGVVGILAGRMKERFHVPSFCFAEGDDGHLKGSGRSIPGIHLRDILANIAAKNPGIFIKFGGHAMAAGLSLKPESLPVFRAALEQEVSSSCAPEVFEKVIWHDGVLPSNAWQLETALALEKAGPWGQHFPEPSFLINACIGKVMAKSEKYCRFEFEAESRVLPAVAFDSELFARVQEGATVAAVIQLSVNRFRGAEQLQARVIAFA